MLDAKLQSLIDFSLQRNTTPAVFQSLLRQLNHRQEISVQDIKAVLSTSTEFEPLKVVYIVSSSLSSQSSHFKLSTILQNLPLATDANQYLILNAYSTELRTDQVRYLATWNTFEISELVTAITVYIRYLLEQRQDNVKLYEYFTNMLNLLIPNLSKELSPVNTQDQTDLFNAFLSELKLKNHEISEALEENLHKFIGKDSIYENLRQSVSSSTQVSSNLNNYSTFIKTNKSAKFVWLNSAILKWETSKDTFLMSFEQFIRIKTSQNVLNELVSVAFEGFVIASQTNEADSFFVLNWRLFLLKRLPILIEKLNLKNPESSLTNAINLVDPKVTEAIKIANGGEVETAYDDMFSSFPSTTTDIRHDFLRECISLGLLNPSSYKTLLKQDAAADSRPLPTKVDLPPIETHLTRVNQVLVDINTEFTSLEDSNLLEFLYSITDLDGVQQEQIATIILGVVDKFIEEDSTSHLYRLSLGLGLTKDSLHAILFHKSPAALLKPLLNFLDRWELSSDEMNFQEAYTSFGGIFLLFLLIVKKFNISLDELITLKTNNGPSFCISYLTRLGSSTQNYSPDSYKSEVILNWITALFDSGGISDDLMRVSTVPECFEIFPNIFQEAFIGCKHNLVDLETVRGGLEYFLQPFLLGTIVGMLAWSESYLWKHQDLDLLVPLLKTLINPSDLSGEAVHLHKIVLTLYGSDLYKVLSSIDKAITNVDSGLLATLKEVSTDYDAPKFFEVRLFGTTNKEEKTIEFTSVLETFHTLFYSLINWNQPSIVSNIDYFQFSKLLHFIDPKTIIEYLVDQITVSHSTNGKNLQLLIDLSIFILDTEFVGTDGKLRSKALHALKTENSLTADSDLSFNFVLLIKRLIEKKKSMKSNDLNCEVFKLFYSKIVESLQTIQA